MSDEYDVYIEQTGFSLDLEIETGMPGSPGQPGLPGQPGASGPNAISSSTSTPLSGILGGNGSVVGVVTVDRSYVGLGTDSSPAFAGLTLNGLLSQAGNGDVSGAPRVLHQFQSTHGDSDAVGWGHSYQAGTIPYLTTDSTPVSYRDHVYCVGLNVKGSQVAIDPTKPYMAYQYESKFTNSVASQFGSEHHFEFREPNATATQRVMSMFLPFDRSFRGLQSYVLQFDTFTNIDQLGVQKYQVELHNNRTLHYAAHSILFGVNNYAPLQQRNAANSANLALPWFNNFDQLVFGNPVRWATAQSAVNSQNSAYSFQCTGTVANNSAIFEINGPSTTVQRFNAFSAVCSSTQEFAYQITNTGGTAASVAKFDAVANGTTSKAVFSARNTGTGGFDWGYDGTRDEMIFSRFGALGIDSLSYATLSRAANVPANSLWTFRGSATVNGTLRINSAGTPIVNVLSATATLDFPSIAANSFADLTITVTGATSGDTVIANPIAGSAVSDVVFHAWVSATNTVTIRAINNSSTTARDPASGTFRATVIRF